jgi:hypothetical protein
LNDDSSQPARFFPFLRQLESSDPSANVRSIELSPADSEECGDVLDLPLGASQLRPLELRDYDILGACDEEQQTK